jgi:nucleolar MIF4G domain-containing protein 1
MRQPTHNTAKLPWQLLDELGVSGEKEFGSRKKLNGPANRKEQRKAARVQKKSSRGQSRTEQPLGARERSRPDYQDDKPRASEAVTQSKPKALPIQPKGPKSILKVPPPKEKFDRATSPSPSPPAQISQGVKDRLAADDAEIAALEKKLGIKQSTKLPKAFEDDGLDSLLEGIDDAVGLNQGGPKKRKRSEADEWLERKRAKAQAVGKPNEDAGNVDFESEGSDTEFNGDELEEEEDELFGQSDSNKEHDADAFDNEDEEDEKNSPARPKKARENPYIAPVAADDATNGGIYVPPSLRNRDSKGSEDLSQLRRQVQGLLNRLSEANLVYILGHVEKLYRDHPRQHISTTLLDLVIGLLSDPTMLQDTFIILHAGFIAAIYKASGIDFGAQAVQRIDEEFALHYSSIDHGSSGKRLTNLISLLTELYNFQVISSNLIYDFIRIFLDDLSEINTELLLKVVRNAGPQLRQDDPSALKDIVLQLQKAVTKMGEDKLSVRTKFMIETMNNLKNNRMKTGITASTITSEHTIRMKKTLGTLNQRNIRASEPLRIGLKDLRNADKRGKWWLVGASYENDTEDVVERETYQLMTSNRDDELNMDSVAADLIQLAKEQRMNTDVRRSIFIAIMSSTDINDSYVRLMKLNLKKSQKLEIPKVLIHCSRAEKVYNPFYAFLSRRVCSEKNLKMAFQFSLWDLFKQMGEGEEEAEDDEKAEGEGNHGLRSIVNLAKTFGVLIAEGGLTLGVLKVKTITSTMPLPCSFTNTVRTSTSPIYNRRREHS